MAVSDVTLKDGVVYVVRFSNYEPAEVLAVFADAEKAIARAEELNVRENTRAWQAEAWDLSD